MSWLPDISECEIDQVVCVAGKNPTPEKITSFCMNVECGVGCPNLVPIAMITAKPEEVIGRRRYQPELDRIKKELCRNCRLTEPTVR